MFVKRVARNLQLGLFWGSGYEAPSRRRLGSGGKVPSRRRQGGLGAEHLALENFTFLSRNNLTLI